MRWPWVSRERLEEAKAQLQEAHRELATLRSEHERLYNWVVWQTRGVAPRPSLLDEAYQPKPAAAPSGVTAANIPPSPRRPMQARMDIARFEVGQEAELERLRIPESKVAERVSSPTPAEVGAKVSKEQEAFLADLNNGAA